MKPLKDHERKRIRKQHEQAIGAQFIEILAECGGPVFLLTECPSETPDLVYKSGERILNIEHTSAQYDEDHRVFIDTPILGNRHPQDVWPRDPLTSTGDCNQKLLASIEKAILEKCKMAKKDGRFGSDPILLIEVLPGHTAAEDLERILSETEFLEDWPFDGVYVVGRFPQTRLRPGVYSTGGFRVLPIKHSGLTANLTTVKYPVEEASPEDEEKDFMEGFEEPGPFRSPMVESRS
ncbi:MAG: hypothetical protein JSR20_14785 [Nitrospira sp.]|nr:hypothetical protein [Nitrospira sp.]